MENGAGEEFGLRWEIQTAKFCRGMNEGNLLTSVGRWVRKKHQLLKRAVSWGGRAGGGAGALCITRCLADNYAFDLPSCLGVADAHTDGHITATLRSAEFPPRWFPARWVTAAWDGGMVGWVGGFLVRGQRRY